MWKHRDTELANSIEENGTDRLAQCRAATNLRFVKNVPCAECNKVKHSKVIQ